MLKKILQLSLQDNLPVAKIVNQKIGDLQPNIVRVQVAYSDINYKDALTLKPNSGVIRNFPRVPGIDFSGWVLASNHPGFQVGDQVVGTGWDIGIALDGGYQEIVDIPGEFLQHLIAPRSLREAMMIGTAGVTAAIGITKVLDSLAMSDKTAPILITGATGGVGGWQLSILAKLGYRHLTAVTRQTDVAETLTRMGATTIVDPNQLQLSAVKPLAKQKYAVVFDNVGGANLTHLIPQIQQNGQLVVSGNAGGIKLETTILPFILRGITMHGIDSVHYPTTNREEIWQLFADHFWPAATQLPPTEEISFDELIPALETFPTAPHLGRTIIKFRSRRPRFR
ncbi:zinc-containing alcohol dehydrogenase (oxidoreductase) [Lapidilactobacillus concavus DSM 17758]|jgi:alcohol dehydrogenase|uniref:Zinc-containing alcohol dehydrogenase (Oxidoreductase) n=1 Tax=Lapidilactobacillus concavus DSM 17758 TaxID=1423735 RepID=A0A0R1W7K2_9LACO|nr:YhdH/YhfP family quinone oxidoreductase [Lapidilactobacillus concavus]KRM13690.1 zinc-containing alcohol dehydrogenase (oxidoreductase) [Lapidilactobacillus concavus DSM 17758]GEL12856.1 quinone oxidoreductase [Lapidilactobacillus concavus]